MLKNTIVGLLFILGTNIFAQSGSVQELYLHEQEALYQKALNLELVGDTTYDVKFYYPDVEIALDQPYISGKVTYLVTAKIDGLTQLKLDLDSAFTVDSVTMAASVFEFEGQVLTVNFSSVYNSGDTIMFAVYYHGIPVLAGGFKGLRYETHNGNQLIIATLSTPYLAHTWWPCKDGTLDKADSLYMDITIKDTLIAEIPVIGVSNGVLSGVETFDNKKKFKWRHRYPIVPYYVMVAISNYIEFEEDYNNGVDSFPLIYYVFESDLISAQAGVADLPEVFDLFTDLFGPYPFANEKYGMTQLGYYGGIENQTNTIINNMSPGWFGTTVHELAHMWFADMITCETWHHGWLNEGFATYSTALWIEHDEGDIAFKNYMESREYFNSGTVYLQEIDDPFNIFQGIIYNKGAWVLNMLRGILGDAVFFEAINTYATSPEFEYKNASTEQFQAVVEEVSGLDLEYFFHQWIYEERYPKYEYNFDYSLENEVLGVTINQVQSISWLEVYTMPVPLLINFNDGTDSLVSVFNDKREQYFSFNLDKEVNDLVFDPGNWILKEATFNPDMPVGIEEITSGQISIYPNPNSGNFFIDLPEQINEEVLLRIFNINGQQIYSTIIPKDKSRHFEINPGVIKKGFYMVELTQFENRWIKKLVVK
jgi:aminopeptidase N